jgi:hypothetical protein
MDWQKVGQKALKGGITGGPAVLVAEYVVSAMTGQTTCDPMTVAFVAGLLTAGVHAAINWWKHRNDDPKITKPEVVGPITG